MPLIKVTSRDNKSTKLIPAKNLETLKQKGKLNFLYFDQFNLISLFKLKKSLASK